MIILKLKLIFKMYPTTERQEWGTKERQSRVQRCCALRTISVNYGTMKDKLQVGFRGKMMTSTLLKMRALSTPVVYFTPLLLHPVVYKNTKYSTCSRLTFMLAAPALKATIFKEIFSSL